MFDRKTNNIQITSENLKNALLELGKTYIPTVSVISDHDITYSYFQFFGQSYENTVGRIMKNPKWLDETITDMDEALEKYKSSAEINKFKEQLSVHLEHPEWYPNVPKVIEDRENLAAKIEPLMKSVKVAYEKYSKAMDEAKKSKDSLELQSEVKSVPAMRA